jgi:hypothetical protein
MDEQERSTKDAAAVQILTVTTLVHLPIAMVAVCTWPSVFKKCAQLMSRLCLEFYLHEIRPYK